MMMGITFTSSGSNSYNNNSYFLQQRLPCTEGSIPGAEPSTTHTILFNSHHSLFKWELQ